MTFEEIKHGWNALREAHPDRLDYFNLQESQAARELFDNRAHLPEEAIHESGLDQFESPEQLLADRDKLLSIACVFSGFSIYKVFEDGQPDLPILDITVENVQRVPSCITIEILSRVWHFSRKNTFPDFGVSIYFPDAESSDLLAPGLSKTANEFFHYDLYYFDCNVLPRWVVIDRVLEKKKASKLDKAVTFASRAHAGACRKGTDTPYIVHPMEVMKIVCGLTYDEDVRVAAVLHDTVEDTGLKIADIRYTFGERVAELVGAESENKREGTPETKTWQIRKQETIDHLDKVSIEARMICLGDKLANLRDIARDWRKLGDGLWERFNAPEDKKENIGWYYGAIGEKIRADFGGTAEFEEYRALMKEVFGRTI